MALEEIRALDDISHPQLYVAWQQAFADYERSWTYPEFEAMLHRRGFEPGLSFGAFIDSQLVSFTLNGIGDFNGIPTAYDTGTGTVQAYRGQGLAGRIFRELLPHLKRAGIGQYLLEVLQHNVSAISVYRRQGFRVSRELCYFFQDMAALPATSDRMRLPFALSQVHQHDRAAMMDMWDFAPSWQNSFDAIDRKPSDFVLIGAFDREQLVGYGILEPASGDITQLAVAPAFHRQGIGSAILAELLRHNKHSSVKAINIEAACVPFIRFLKNAGIPQRGTQYEMIRALS